MKKLLLLSIIVLLTSSCLMTKKGWERRYPLVSDTITKVIYRDSLVFRDTTIFITLPKEVKIDSVMIPCPAVEGYVPDSVKIENKWVKAWSWWDFPFIKMKVEVKDTTLAFRLDSAIREAYHWKSLYNQVNIVKTVTKIPVMGWVAMGAVFGFILFILGLVLFARRR